MRSNKVIAFGEIIWDILPTGRVLGGAPANFATRLQSLGYEVTLVSRVGRDDLGLEALRQLGTQGMNLGLIGLDDHYPTGIATVGVQIDGTPVFTIQSDVAYDHIPLTTQLLDSVRGADFFCFGSLAQRSEFSRATLRASLSESSATRVLDLNLRKDCFKPTTVMESLSLADILKLNEDEAHYLRTLLAWPQLDHHNLSQRLLEEFELEVCLITLGAEGVIAASRGQPPIHVPGFVVEVLDTCGSGDAFTAAFLDAYARGESLFQACREGNALGAVVAATLGATTPIPDHQRQLLLQTPACN
ncbi:MAG: carbohydrate kinase [Pedosphaera sp.]|nr:carbohydrate kinase [Pedosphaera sp.]